MNLRDVLTRAAEAGGAWDVDHVADLIERRTRLRVELTADHRVRVCDARGRRLYRADGGAFDIGDVVAQVAIEKPFLFHPTMEEEEQDMRHPKALALADTADEITRARFGAADLAVASKPDLTPVSDADHAVEERE